MRGWVCCLKLLLALASTFILRSESRGTHEHILLSQIHDSSNLKGQVPQEQGGQLCPRALGSLFGASYDSHSYGGGNRTRLHPGSQAITRWTVLNNLSIKVS
jgi:hypothetical protein